MVIAVVIVEAIAVVALVVAVEVARASQTVLCK
jgi:hypothetical protein